MTFDLLTVFFLLYATAGIFNGRRVAGRSFHRELEHRWEDGYIQVKLPEKRAPNIGDIGIAFFIFLLGFVFWPMGFLAWVFHRMDKAISQGDGDKWNFVFPNPAPSPSRRDRLEKKIKELEAELGIEDR